MLFIRPDSEYICVHYIVFGTFHMSEIVYNCNNAILVLDVYFEYEHLKNIDLDP